MSDANPQQEPSMEEILASIRRIISEDDQPEGEQPAEAVEADSEEPVADEGESDGADDVLELTDVVEEEAAADDAEEAEPDADDGEELSIDDVLDEVDVPDELELRDDDPPEEAPAAPEPSPAQPEDAGLIADQTAAAAGGMLSGLVAAVDRAHGGSTLGDGNRTIEDLVKEVMRPMVKEWLDENLPNLTERLVRREIERLARRAEDD
jgi:cell pole-organizing protein PopZ